MTLEAVGALWGPNRPGANQGWKQIAIYPAVRGAPCWEGTTKEVKGSGREGGPTTGDPHEPVRHKPVESWGQFTGSGHSQRQGSW